MSRDKYVGHISFFGFHLLPYLAEVELDGPDEVETVEGEEDEEADQQQDHHLLHVPKL